MIAYVAERGAKVESSLATTMTVTLTGNTSVGNRLFLILGARAGDVSNPYITDISDGRGNTWTVDKDFFAASSNHYNAIASCYIGTANQTSDTVTITFATAVGASRAATLQEFSGVALFDEGGSAEAGSGTAVSVSTDGTTDTADELVLVSVTGFGIDTAFTVGANYSEFTTKAQTDGASRVHYGEYRIVTSIGIQTATATMGAGDNGWTAAIAAFRSILAAPLLQARSSVRSI